jgi:DNA-directed RNA polymerase subunit beta'
MGGEAVSMLLKNIDVEFEISKLTTLVKDSSTSIAKVEAALKRLRVLKKFDPNKKELYNKPEWMVLSILPVIPPDLRPLVPLDGGRFAASDLNDYFE